MEKGSDQDVDTVKKKYEYFCYVDVLEHYFTGRMQLALKHIRELTPFARVLGSYQADGETTDELCQALLARATVNQPKAPIACQALRILIVGFGNFGRFLAKEFSKRHTVYGTSVDHNAQQSESEVCAQIGCTWVAWSDLEEFLIEQRVDVLLIATSIPSFEFVVGEFPKDALRQSQALVVDVLSVKEFPRLVLLRELPEECDILCTHPMFGPESGKYGWYGLAFVFELVRARNWQRARSMLNIFEEARCRMVCMPCKEHDEQAAATQFLTHYIGRLLASHGCKSTSVDLKGFESLCKVVDNTCKDSFDLFYGLFKYNKLSSDTISRLKRTFANIETWLNFPQHKCLQEAGVSEDTLWVPHVSSIAKSISESRTAAVQALATKLQREGRNVNAALCIGEPDYAPPPEVLRSASLAGGGLGGDVQLRQEICEDLKQRKAVVYKPSQICISDGGKQALYQAVTALLEDDDEVLIPTPCWVSYYDMVRLCRAVPVQVETLASDGYLLRPEALEASLRASGSKCKALILCNPNNPTGAVIPADVLKGLAVVLQQPEFRHVYIITDEIYERLVFDTPHVCFASLPAMQHRTLLVSGFSKGFAMTGYRLGYLAANQHVIEKVTKLQALIAGPVSSSTQKAGIVALRDVSAQWTDARVQELRVKRDFVLQRLREMPGVVCQTPEGAFYALPDISCCMSAGSRVQTAEAFCKVLLEDYNVALTPGEAFRAPSSVRISYACSLEDLENAMTAFAACVEAVRV